MAEIFVLEPATADESVDRIPEGLPVGSPERRTLERALRRAGLAIVPVDAVIDSADVGATSSDRRRLRASVAAVVDAATDAELVRLESAVVSDSGDDLDESFWGPAPNSVTASKAVFADLTDQFAQRRRLAADSISRDEAAELLDVAAQSVTAKLATRKLVGMKIGREWRLPVWQFEPEAPCGVLPDLDQLQAAFPGGLISLSRWMLCGHAEFDGRTPRDEMLLHGSAPVIAVARALTAAGW